MRQLRLFKKGSDAYGGENKNRHHARPLSTKNTIHLVLRSSRAKGELSMLRPKHAQRVSEIMRKFARKHGVRILTGVNVGNHIHLHIQLASMRSYTPFIRAVTSAIAMAVTGESRWKKIKAKFWDLRPFTRIVRGLRGFMNVKNYLRLNVFESYGYSRNQARHLVKFERMLFSG